MAPYFFYIENLICQPLHFTIFSTFFKIPLSHLLFSFPLLLSLPILPSGEFILQQLHFIFVGHGRKESLAYLKPDSALKLQWMLVRWSNSVRFSGDLILLFGSAGVLNNILGRSTTHIL